MSLYEYGLSNPNGNQDPQGLFCVWPIIGARIAVCQNEILNLISQNIEIKRLLKVMKDGKCPNPSPTCLCCSNDRPCPDHATSCFIHGPRFKGDPFADKVFLCANRIRSLDDIRRNLIHELTHACHYCLDPLIKRLERDPCEQRICAEIRAYKADGSCSGDYVGTGKFRCYYQHVKDSIVETKNGKVDWGVCRTEDIFKGMFKIVYERCLNEKGPCEKEEGGGGGGGGGGSCPCGRDIKCWLEFCWRASF